MPKLSLPPMTRDEGGPHPVLGGPLGPYSYVTLGEAAGITQFGAHIEVLHPGSRSSHRHWHEEEDELIYMISGEVVLIEDVETILKAGDTAAWAKGTPVGHCLENRSNKDATYLTVGTRKMADTVHYTDAGVTMTIKDRRHRRFFNAAGTVIAEYES